MSEKFDLIELLSNALQSRRTSQFIRRIGRNRPIGLLFAINGSDEMHRMRIITVKSWPLDLRPTAEMKPRRERYKNASNSRRRIAIVRF